MEKKTKILIVRLSAIGDVVHSLPILHALKTTYPDVFIGWAVEDKAADIIINNPLVDKVHIMPKKLWKKRGMSLKSIVEFIKFIKEIKDENYTISIDLQELFKSGIISFLSGAKKRIAHSGAREFSYIFANEKLPYHDNFDINKPIIQRYLEPAKYLGASIDEVKFSLPSAHDDTKIYVDKLFENIDKTKKNVVFSPATIWESKHWIEQYWSELLDKVSEQYNVIFTGAENDMALISRIKNNAKNDNSLVIAGKTNIGQLIEVFNRTDIVIAPDTGPVHIANATEKPTIICIFGSTSFKRSGPYGEKHFSLSSKPDCQPCFKRHCPKKNNKMECMKKITPDQVFEIIRNI